MQSAQVDWIGPAMVLLATGLEYLPSSRVSAWPLLGLIVAPLSLFVL